jgi:hydroxypyruvate isomerase
MPRFAANLGWLFPERPFLQRFGAARRAGFDAVEFAVPYDHPAAAIAAQLREHALECILFNVPSGDKSRGDFGLACRPERVAEFRAGVGTALEYAAALGTKRINVIAGLERPGDDPAALHATFVSNLRFAAAAMARSAIQMVMEPINNVDFPGYYFPRCGPAAALVEEVGAENFGLQCDLYHVAMMGEDPAATLDALWPVIRHVQFADVPGRGEPGTGRLDFHALFAQIDRRGYAGWTAAEYRPSRTTEDTLGWMRWC